MANDDYDDIDDPVENDDTDDEAEDIAEMGGESDAEEGEGKAAPARDDVAAEAETLSVSSKEAQRRQMEEEVARFLAKGGKVQEVPPDPTADPHYKPD